MILVNKLNSGNAWAWVWENLLFHLAQWLLIVSIVLRTPVHLAKFLVLLPMSLLTLPRTVESALTASTGVEFFFGIKLLFSVTRRTFGSVFGAIVILVEWSDPFGRHPACNDQWFAAVGTIGSAVVVPVASHGMIVSSWWCGAKRRATRRTWKGREKHLKACRWRAWTERWVPSDLSRVDLKSSPLLPKKILKLRRDAMMPLLRPALSIAISVRPATIVHP